MRAGQLRHRLTLLRSSPVAVGDTGNPDITFTDEGKIWGSVEPLDVKEALVGQAVELNATHMIRIRYHSTINEKWQIKFGQRTFEIESILPVDSRRIEMRILVKEER